MVSRSARTRRCGENQYTAIGMGYFLYFNPESHTPKKLICSVHEIWKCGSADHRTWRSIRDPENQMSASFVCKRYAVLSQLSSIEGTFRLLELKQGSLGERIAPQIDLNSLW